MEQEVLRLEGTVESLIFENRDTGYTVFELSGGGELFVVCGTVGEVHVGETVVCHGRFETHPNYGRQFHAETCEADVPQDGIGVGLRAVPRPDEVEIEARILRRIRHFLFGVPMDARGVVRGRHDEIVIAGAGKIRSAAEDAAPGFVDRARAVAGVDGIIARFIYR